MEESHIQGDHEGESERESIVKKKVWFYIALYPVRWTAQSALHFPPLTDLFIPTPFSASLGSILAMQQLRNDYSLTFPPLSIARYSFIQLSRLRRREVKENAQNFETVTTGIRTRALSIASPAFYQLSYRAPQCRHVRLNVISRCIVRMIVNDHNYELVKVIVLIQITRPIVVTSFFDSSHSCCADSG